jgi:replication factor C subunit 3/5
MDSCKNKENIPLVEKYRPTNFESIVLDPLNKQILNNIIETSSFPNLLFYGPPGTGKTTTIINLINAYQEKIGKKNKDLIIHLNASDERGIDIIRNQIYHFVNSKPLFDVGMKFVILDEVDYMTKSAQQALRYLLQNHYCNIRFCLICNYISKIYDGLQNEFIKLRFNQLPKYEIISFLQTISKCEKLNLSEESLNYIQKIYKSDFRSMINFIQSNYNIIKHTEINTDVSLFINFNIINDNVWENLINKILNKESLNCICNYIYEISTIYNIDKKNIIKEFLNYIIRNYHNKVNTKFMSFVENVMHSININDNIYIHYVFSQLLVIL